MELGRAYKKVLPASHRRALGEAAEQLITVSFDDLSIRRGSDWSPASCLLATLLPPQFLPKYSLDFMRRFFMCFTTVVWKLDRSRQLQPACTAEELAGHILIRRAEEILDQRGETADFNGLIDWFFEDTDCLFLYETAMDGFELTAFAQEMRMVNLNLSDWFEPFKGPDDPKSTVHAYARRTD